MTINNVNESSWVEIDKLLYGLAAGNNNALAKIVDRLTASPELERQYQSLIINNGLDSLRLLDEDRIAFEERSFHAHAMLRLGLSYFYGIGVKKNSKDAAHCFTESASLENIFAKYFLGECYDLGIGVYKNWREAISCYVQAAQANVPQALHKVGTLSEFGIDVTQAGSLIYDAGRHWVLVIDSKYRSRMGRNALKHGCYKLVVNTKRSKKFFTKNFRYSDYKYDHSMGLRRAFEYYKEAAELNYTPANCACAHFYRYGLLGCSLKSLALNEYKKAAKQNSPEALYQLATFYEVGEVVVKDIERAVLKYTLAAQCGYEKAINRLEQLGVSL